MHPALKEEYDWQDNREVTEKGTDQGPLRLKEL